MKGIGKVMKNLFGFAVGLGIGVGAFIASVSAGACLGALGYKNFDETSREDWDDKYGDIPERWTEACHEAAN